jgi:hypothetical protein
MTAWLGCIENPGYIGDADAPAQASIGRYQAPRLGTGSRAARQRRAVPKNVAPCGGRATDVLGLEADVLG